MGWFSKKSKKEKIINLQSEVDLLNDKYEQYFNKLCLVDGEIVIYKYFYIKDDEILLGYVNKDTYEDKIFGKPWWHFKLQYDSSDFIINQRNDFLRLKHSLKALNFEIKQI